MSAILKQKLIDIANGFTKYGLWKGDGSGGSSALSDMSDVTLSNLQSNDVLTYNGSFWVNDDNLQKQIDTLNSNFGKINHIKTIDFVNGISFKWTVAGLQPIIDSSEQLPLLKNITNSNGYIKSITLDYSGNWKLKIIFHVDGIDYEKYISLS